MSLTWIGKSKKAHKIETKIRRKKKRMNLKIINIERVADALIEFLRKLKRLKITIDDYYTYSIQQYDTSGLIFSLIPYGRQGSFLFLKSVKFGFIDRVRQCLKLNKYYVYDFDEVKQINSFFLRLRR